MSLYNFQMYYLMGGILFSIVGIFYYYPQLGNHPQFGLVFQSSWKVRLLMTTFTMAVLLFFYPLFIAELIGTAISKLLRKTQGGK